MLANRLKANRNRNQKGSAIILAYKIRDVTYSNQANYMHLLRCFHPPTSLHKLHKMCFQQKHLQKHCTSLHTFYRFEVASGSLSSISFGVSLWDMPLPRIPQKSYYITPAPIGWQMWRCVWAWLPHPQYKGSDTTSLRHSKTSSRFTPEAFNKLFDEQLATTLFSPDSFNFAFQQIARIVWYYDGCSNAVCTS